MFRITRLPPAQGHETLRLEGRLTGPWVDELARTVEASPSPAARLVLDVSSVTFVDGAGVALLRALASTRAELQGGSTFVLALVNGGIDDCPR